MTEEFHFFLLPLSPRSLTLIENKKHYVTKVSNTKLTSLLPESFLVNSYHHQSVKDLPDGFITTFVNQDVIEAIEHQTLPLIGIQWHPERLSLIHI